jgi:serine/threonine-protein kinase
MKRAALSALAVLALAALGQLGPGPSPARAAPGDQKLAQQAKVILEKHCAKCHSVVKSAGLDVRDHKGMTTVRKKRKKDYTFVAPRDLKNSPLWQQIESDGMPLEGDPMPQAEKKIVKAWIEAGAPPFAAAVAAKRPYVGIKEVLTAIRDHLREAEHEDRPYLRYFTMTHLHNNPDITNEQLGRYYAALSKVLNSMHWKKAMVIPAPIDRNKTVFAIDLRDLDWDKKGHEKVDRWTVMLRRYPYGLDYSDSDDDATVRIDREVRKLSQYAIVDMRGDWFVAHAARPPLYEAVLRLPKTAYELEKKLGVDVLANFKRNRLARAGYAKSFVSGQNRLVERHDALYGAYWKSYDFKRGKAKGNLNDFPLGPNFGRAYGGAYPWADVAFVHDGGEMIFNLPNGLQGYYLTEGTGKHIDKGPVDVVSDDKKTSGTAEIVNGLSCMACHKNGMIETVLDEVRMGNSVSGLAKRKVKRLYPPRAIMLKYVEEDRELFLAALEKAVRPFLAGADRDRPIRDVAEPIGELVRTYYNPDLTLAVAAYELGYEKPGDLKTAIRGNEKLRELGLRTLLGGGLLKREDWDQQVGSSLYHRSARHLGIGTMRKGS